MVIDAKLEIEGPSLREREMKAARRGQDDLGAGVCRDVEITSSDQRPLDVIDIGRSKSQAAGPEPAQPLARPVVFPLGPRTEHGRARGTIDDTHGRHILLETQGSPRALEIIFGLIEAEADKPVIVQPVTTEHPCAQDIVCGLPTGGHDVESGTDVPALGLAIGYAVGDTVADAHDARRGELEPRWVPDSIGPLIADDGAGLALKWRF